MPLGFSSSLTGGSSGGSSRNSSRPSSNLSSPSTRNNYQPGTNIGSQGGAGGYTYRPPTILSTYRQGDYIYTAYSNGTIDKTYSPVPRAANNVTRPATGAFGSSANAAKAAQQTGGFSQVARATGSTQYMPGGGSSGTGGGASTGGGAGGGGNVGGGSATGGLNDNGVGELFGWTKGLTETDVMRGLEYPMRILQQVSGRDLSTNPAFANFMNPIVSAISNPNTQLLFNPQLGGKNTTTGSEGYNFIADMVKGFMTPGGALPDVGSALARIASALGNNQSGIYNLLMQGANAGGAAQGQSGMGAYGAMFDALSGMLDPILQLGMSPLQSMITNASLNNLMNNFMMNVNDNSENPLAYVLRGLGYNTNIAAMPQIAQTGADTTNYSTGGGWGPH